MKIAFIKQNENITNNVSFFEKLIMEYIKKSNFPKSLLIQNLDLKIEKLKNIEKDLIEKMKEINKQIEFVKQTNLKLKKENEELTKNLIKLI